MSTTDPWQRPPPQAVLPVARSLPLHGSIDSRAIERAAAAALPPHTLMARAGATLARLALAVAPHARCIHVWCGPGNNGGDGFVAARWLHAWGRRVCIVAAGRPAQRPADAEHAWQQAREAGVPVADTWPAPGPADLMIDALLGLGLSRPLDGELAAAVAHLNSGHTPVLAADLPSGLDGDTGCVHGVAVRAAHTLSLLTLKPGLFTAHGRDHAGRVWFDDLGVTPDHVTRAVPVEGALRAATPGADAAAADARPTTVSSASATPALLLAGADVAQRLTLPRAHAAHKGSFGDAIVIGGAPGMTGAAGLAARAALAAGAGRVYAGLLGGDERTLDGTQLELMHRAPQALCEPAWLQRATVVCGCGGGAAVRQVLPPVLHHALRLVLDADALNALADDAALMRALRSRAARGLTTVITPHPLEAARLLARDTAHAQSDRVQADRVSAARALADAAQCTVLLKGSGSVIASPDGTASINPTGDARLASAGTGDVLAGWIGGQWSASPQSSAADVVSASAWLHGAAVEHAPVAGPLRASALVEAMVQARVALHMQR